MNTDSKQNLTTVVIFSHLLSAGWEQKNSVAARDSHFPK